ncbi:MAG: 50S ribosomal protein L4 [Planctomycetota bacterium]|jgi:large subunit ribosomal protein L4
MSTSIPILKSSGELAERAVNAETFRRRGKKVLLKEFVIMAEARKRVGTHSAKTRAEISGTTAKMYRQKGTGTARKGNRKAPQLRGGGMAFAKKPRDYGWQMPKKARRAALAAAIRGKLDDGEVKVVESFGIDKPRTKDFVELLGKLGIEGSCLIVPAVHQDALWRSSRNIRNAGYRIAADLNAYEVLRHGTLVLEESALSALEERFSNG